MSLCPTPGLAPVKSPLREIFDNPAYPVPAAVRKRAEFFLFFADVIYPMFDPSLLVVFRKRLLTGELESLVFQAVLDRLVKDGWMAKRSKQRLDSTHVCGLLSHMSRLECVRETIRLALNIWNAANSCWSLGRRCGSAMSRARWTIAARWKR